MRVSRLFMAAGLALIVAISSAAILSAQAKTDEDYDKLMKGVGAANGTIAKATDGATIAAEAKKLQALFKDAQQFWTARKNTEAADMGGVSDDACRGNREGGDREQHGKRRGAPEGTRRRVPGVPQGQSREDRNRLRDSQARVDSATLRISRVRHYLTMAAIAIAMPPSVSSVTFSCIARLHFAASTPTTARTLPRA